MSARTAAWWLCGWLLVGSWLTVSALPGCGFEALSLEGFPCAEDADCTPGGTYYCGPERTCQPGTAPPLPDASEPAVEPLPPKETPAPDEPTSHDDAAATDEPAPEPQPEPTPEPMAEPPPERPPVPESICQPSQTRACYSGPVNTSGVGACRTSLQRCTNGRWETRCDGEFTPRQPACPHFRDEDCDGTPDPPKPCTWLLTTATAPGQSQPSRAWSSPRLLYDSQGALYFGGRINGDVQLGPITIKAPDYEGFVAKVDSQGKPQWGQLFGSATKAPAPKNEQLQALAMGPRDRLYVGGVVPGPFTLAGKTHPYLFGTTDGYAASLDALGQIIWGFVVTGRSHQAVGNIIHDGDRHLYISGHGSQTTTLEATYPNPGSSRSFTATSSSDPSRPDVFVAKYTETGQLVWLRRFLSPGWLRVWFGGGLHITNDGRLHGVMIYSSKSAETLSYSTPPTQRYSPSEDGWHVLLFQLDADGQFQRIIGSKYITYNHTQRNEARVQLCVPRPQSPQKESFVYGSYIGTSRLFHETTSVKTETTTHADGFITRLHETTQGFQRAWLAEIKSAAHDYIHHALPLDRTTGHGDLLVCGSVGADARFVSQATAQALTIETKGRAVGFVARLRATDGAWLAVKTFPATLASACKSMGVTPSGALHVLGEFRGTIDFPDKRQHVPKDDGEHLFLWRTSLAQLFP